MSHDKVIVNHYGVSFLGLLGLLFIGLKLAGHITWSWWLVTLPLWILPALLWSVLIVVMICAFWASL